MNTIYTPKQIYTILLEAGTIGDISGKSINSVLTDIENLFGTVPHKFEKVIKKVLTDKRISKLKSGKTKILAKAKTDITRELLGKRSAPNKWIKRGVNPTKMFNTVQIVYDEMVGYVDNIVTLMKNGLTHDELLKAIKNTRTVVNEKIFAASNVFKPKNGRLVGGKIIGKKPVIEFISNTSKKVRKLTVNLLPLKTINKVTNIAKNTANWTGGITAPIVGASGVLLAGISLGYKLFHKEVVPIKKYKAKVNWLVVGIGSMVFACLLLLLKHNLIGNKNVELIIEQSMRDFKSIQKIPLLETGFTSRIKTAITNFVSIPKKMFLLTRKHINSVFQYVAGMSPLDIILSVIIIGSIYLITLQLLSIFTEFMSDIIV